MRQTGDLGVQMVAPSSINPWLKSPGLSSGTSILASDHSCLIDAEDLMLPSSSNTRASTRATFPSTTGSRRPNAMDAIAPAVYGPTPGSSSSPSSVRGTDPPARCTTNMAPR